MRALADGIFPNAIYFIPMNALHVLPPQPSNHVRLWRHKSSGDYMEEKLGKKNAFWFGLGNPRRPKICSIQFMQNRAWTVSASQCWKILRRSHPGFLQNWFRNDFPGGPGTFTAIKTSASMTSVQQSAACKGYARQFPICTFKNQEWNPHNLPSNVPSCEIHHWIGNHLRQYFVSIRLGSSLRLDYVFPYLGRSAWATMLLMQLT